MAVWRAEPDPACLCGGAAFRVAYPGRPGTRRGCAPGVPWPNHYMVARARYAGARLGSGRGGYPSVTHPRCVRRPGRGTRGGLWVPFRVRDPVRGGLNGQVPQAGPGAGESSARGRCELDPRPAPTPPNMAVSISESRPTQTSFNVSITFFYCWLIPKQPTGPKACGIYSRF